MDIIHNGFHEYDSEQCSALLSKLPGVYAARLRFEDGDLVEIHVLGATDRNAKQIARDIQSAIFATYGVEVDHRIISIAQLPSDPFTPAAHASHAEPAESHHEVRPLFSGMESNMSGGQFHVSVHLFWDGHDLTGEGKCRDSLVHRNRTIARATLDAVNAFLGNDYFSLLEVKQVNIWDVTVVVTVIEYLEKDDADPVILIGAATQKDNAAAGIVRSTLDGLNRSLGKLYPSSKN